LKSYRPAVRAVRQQRFGGPEVLTVEEVPDLQPDAGQVRIAVAAAGVHLHDATIRQGEASGPFPLPALPMTPGREVAGTVDALGNGAEPTWLGRQVVAHLGQASGGYAAQAVAPVAALIGLADDVDAAEAVAMVGTGRTALGVLAEAGLRPDDVVLVTAAAGGIGSLLVQAACHAGAFTIGAAGGDAKVALVDALGADVAVDYLDPAWPDAVRARLPDGRGVTVALESVGGAIGRAAFDLVAPGGRVVMVGFSCGEMIELTAGDLFAHGVAVTAAIGPRMFARPGGIQGLAEQAVAQLAGGVWHPLVTRFALDDAAAAHGALVERQTTGKVVLIP
jgi:NADPH2:quinone reductase